MVLLAAEITARTGRDPARHHQDLTAQFGTSFYTRGWFAARPSGTENIYKMYAESFRNETHLNAILNEAGKIATNALNLRGSR